MPATPPITLTWPNKHQPARPAPAQPILRETYCPSPADLPATTPCEAPATPSGANQVHGAGARHEGNVLYHADNLPLLAHLLESGWGGRFRLIYADPPYNSGLYWARKVRLRGPAVGASPEAGPGMGPAAAGREALGRQPQYADAWDPAAYLQFLYARLPLLRDLLADDGALWLHCDHRHSHHLRCLLEEVFGAKNYLNTITWRSQAVRGAKVNAFFFANSAHTIHIFAKDRGAPPLWNGARKTRVLSEAEAAAEFMADERGFFRTSDPGDFSFASLQRLHAEGRLYAPYGGEVVLDEATRRASCSNGGNIGVKYYLADLGGGRYAVERGVDNIWEDIPGLGTTPGEELGYPTQKTEALLRRILEAATAPGDWVLDPFAGSGTTLAVAQQLGRRWAGCDANYGAIQTARRRLYALLGPQTSSSAPPAEQTRTSALQGRGEQTRTSALQGRGEQTRTSALQGEQTRTSAVQEAPHPAFAIYGAAPLSTGGPQVHLSITPIPGDATRIRLTVARVTWPPTPGEPASESAGGVAAALAADWRAGVDEIAIDGAYVPGAEGGSLHVTLADAPRKRKERVTGEYIVPTPPPGATVAVRVTDIWGREGIVSG